MTTPIGLLQAGGMHGVEVVNQGEVTVDLGDDAVRLGRGGSDNGILSSVLRLTLYCPEEVAAIGSIRSRMADG